MSSLVPKMVIQLVHVIGGPINHWHGSKNGSWDPPKMATSDASYFGTNQNVTGIWLGKVSACLHSFWGVVLRVCCQMQSSHGLVLVSPGPLVKAIFRMISCGIRAFQRSFLWVPGVRRCTMIWFWLVFDSLCVFLAPQVVSDKQDYQTNIEGLPRFQNSAGCSMMWGWGLCLSIATTTARNLILPMTRQRCHSLGFQFPPCFHLFTRNFARTRRGMPPLKELDCALVL